MTEEQEWREVKGSLLAFSVALAALLWSIAAYVVSRPWGSWPWVAYWVAMGAMGFVATGVVSWLRTREQRRRQLWVEARPDWEEA